MSPDLPGAPPLNEPQKPGMHPSLCRGPHGLGVPGERSLLRGVKGQLFFRGVAGRRLGDHEPQPAFFRPLITSTEKDIV
jgi:hypothetical protein